jgi:hypothetical protein
MKQYCLLRRSSETSPAAVAAPSNAKLPKPGSDGGSLVVNPTLSR